MKKKLYVTGLTGFVGGYIQSAVKSSQYLLQDEKEFFVNLLEPEKLLKSLQQSAPDFVIHLAAKTFVPDSFKDPRSYFDVNLIGTLNLLECLDKINFKGRLLFVGTGDVYGMVGEESMPIKEIYPLRPRNPYAVSKVSAEALCYQWSQTGNFEIILARPFNHVGPGQAENFVISAFAKQVAEIVCGLKEPKLAVGDIDVSRDFTDVRDVVQAYLLLLEHGGNGEIFNVCSGKERYIRDILQQLLTISGVKADIIVDSERVRCSEQQRVWGSYDKLAEVTSWKPRVALEQTLEEMLQYWKEKLNA